TSDCRVRLAGKADGVRADRGRQVGRSLPRQAELRRRETLAHHGYASEGPGRDGRRPQEHPHHAHRVSADAHV
ncbi:hypothetical protein AAVH_37264, partial [Aphelenchoides avenae]